MRATSVVASTTLSPMPLTLVSAHELRTIRFDLSELGYIAP